MLPVSADDVISRGQLIPQLFDLPDTPSLEAFVLNYVNSADAWMFAHMGSTYNLLTPTQFATLQYDGQVWLTLYEITLTLRGKKTEGTHYPYVQEESPNWQQLSEVYLQQARRSLDLWVTVEPMEPHGFAMPVFSPTAGVGPSDRLCDPTFRGVSQQYSDELDFARGLSDPDVGTLRR